MPESLASDEAVTGPGLTGYVNESDALSHRHGSAWYSLASADYECEHGRVAGDRLDGEAPNWPHKHPCGCWPSEVQRELRPITPEHAPTTARPTRADRAPIAA